MTGHEGSNWACGPAVLLGGVLLLAGCSGGDADGSNAAAANGDGTSTAAWAGFCTGTFTKDTEIRDVFDEPEFTAQVGDEYLLTSFDDAFGHGEFLYLTSAGPDSFEVARDEAGEWPFTSNCAEGTAVPYYAAFTAVTVYAEAELQTKICEIDEGTALPAAGGQRGYATAGDSFSLNGPQTYEIFLDAFGAQCGGHESGFVSVPQTHLFGAETWLVPIESLLKPP